MSGGDASSAASVGLWRTGEPSVQPPVVPGMRIERLLGEGGFGAVWLAEQHEPVRRRIALKVLRTTMPGPRLRARFDAERQLLARMEHPGVARIYDAGETGDGRLWFAMEYVEGEPVDRWCDRKGSAVRDRIGLLVQACAAVQHAHSKGVVHCDLKPSNILVSEVDGHPVVKVIDFGVSRVTSDTDALPTLGSEGAGPLGTLEFMAPEQVRDGKLADTRTDVWALGVVLYQQLCGSLPFESRTLRSGGLYAAAQMISDVDPVPPSGSLRASARSDPEGAERLAHARGVPWRRLCALTAPELDWIAMRCLEKDPERRYSGVAALADDLERWLRDEAVTAGPPNAALRVRKFVRRNRLGVAVGATAAIGVLGALAGTGYGLVQAQRNLALAEQQLARFERLRDFNASILSAVEPSTARGMDTRLLRLMIDSASAQIDTQFADDAAVASDVHRTVGVAYRSIGEWDEAEGHLRRTLEMVRADSGDGSLATLRAQNDLGEVLLARGRVTDAAPLLESTHGGRVTALGADHPDTLVSLHNLALLRDAQAELLQAEALGNELVERRTRALGPEADGTLRSRANLADVQRQLGKREDALRNLDAVVAVRLERLGPEHPDTLSARQSRALILRVSGKLADAQAELDAIMPVMQAVLGESHADTVSARHSAASIRRDSGDVAGAANEFRALALVLESSLGPDHVRTLIVRNDLAAALEMQGQLEEAEAIGRDVLERYRRTLGESAPRTMTATNNLGYVYWAMGRHEDAERHWSIAADGFEKAVGPDHANTIGAKAAVARAMVARGAAAEARPLVERVALEPPAGLSAARRMQTILVYARILAAQSEATPAQAQFDRAWQLAGEDRRQQAAVLEQVSLAGLVREGEHADQWRSRAAILESANTESAGP
jgi:tetratricopeptide (TPR) repeat protein/predicted Ser/Thr protein kinase